MHPKRHCLGLLGPEAVPAEVRTRLSTTTIRVLKTSEVIERAAKDGYEIVASSPAQFVADMRKESDMLERVIRDNAIKLE